MPAPRRRNVRGHNPWNTGPVDLRLEIPGWTKDALCAQIGVEVFFSEVSGDHATTRAKHACMGCPVRVACLEWALTFENDDDQYGVFGGTGPAERKRLRRERQKEVAA